MWSLTLSEEHKLQIFEDKLLKTNLGPKKNERNVSFRVLQNAEFCFLNRSPSAVRRVKYRRLRRAGHVARVGQTFFKNVFGRLRSKWQGIIRMSYKEGGFDEFETLVSVVLNHQVLLLIQQC
jgi:hypothetical protein